MYYCGLNIVGQQGGSPGAGFIGDPAQPMVMNSPILLN